MRYRVVFQRFLDLSFRRPKLQETAQDILKCVALYLRSPKGFMERSMRPTPWRGVFWAGCLRTREQIDALSGRNDSNHSRIGWHRLYRFWFGAFVVNQERQDDPSSSIIMTGVSLLLQRPCFLFRYPLLVLPATFAHTLVCPHSWYSEIGLADICTLLQAVFYHGGITTLGVNTLTLDFGTLCTIGLWIFLQNYTSIRPSVWSPCAIGSLSVYVIDALVPRLLYMTSQPRRTHLPVLPSALHPFKSHYHFGHLSPWRLFMFWHPAARSPARKFVDAPPFLFLLDTYFVLCVFFWMWLPRNRWNRIWKLPLCPAVLQLIVSLISVMRGGSGHVHSHSFRTRFCCWTFLGKAHHGENDALDAHHSLFLQTTKLFGKPSQVCLDDGSSLLECTHRLHIFHRWFCWSCSADRFLYLETIESNLFLHDLCPCCYNNHCQQSSQLIKKHSMIRWPALHVESYGSRLGTQLTGSPFVNPRCSSNSQTIVASWITLYAGSSPKRGETQRCCSMRSGNSCLSFQSWGQLLGEGALQDFSSGRCWEKCTT